MSKFNKTQVSVAANPIHRFPKNYTHTTTGNFMEFQLATVMESPKAALDCLHKTFVRTFPLKRPLLSNINIHKQAYFVPYRTIWEPWSDFRTDTPHNTPSGTFLLGNTPLIDILSLMDIFRDADYSTFELTTPSDLKHGCDFFVTISGVDYYHTFTNKGRWLWKLLNSMGLRLPFPDYDSLKEGQFTIDALPLLAVAKVYLDYFFPNQYAHYGDYAFIDGIMNRHYIYTLTQSELEHIFDAIYKVTYSDDYFVSAFDNPIVGANGVQSTDFHISDITLVDSNLGSAASDIIQADNATPAVQGQLNRISTFSQYIDSHLKALTNYIRRHSLAGSRALTRYLSDWGVTLSADKLRRCYKLSETVFPLQVGDVTSTSDTLSSSGETGSQLGDYAGRAVAFNGDFKFDCETDEDGIFVVTCTIVPTVSYVQGIQRYWFHKTKLDFLTPDFDGLSIREIRQIELFCGTKRPNSLNGLFAFIPSYAENKVDYDILSGDFACDTKNLGLLGFESARLFSDELGDSIFNEVHGLDFVLGNDSSQFNRIFFDDESDADKFILIHRAEMQHRMPSVPLYDSYDFEDGKRKILLEVNGAKDN